MKKVYKIKLAYGVNGLPRLRPTKGMHLSAGQYGNQTHIKGNRAGLLFLAEALVQLAQLDENIVAEGYHVHLDDLYQLNEANIEFILYRDVEGR